MLSKRGLTTAQVAAASAIKEQRTAAAQQGGPKRRSCSKSSGKSQLLIAEFARPSSHMSKYQKQMKMRGLWSAGAVWRRPPRDTLL